MENKRIFVISAHYPPYHSGGYEIRVMNIMDELNNRGHNIQVLTTKPEKQNQHQNETSQYQVTRKLHNRNKSRFFPKEILFDLLDTKTLEREIKRFNPDIIYLGHIYPLSKTIFPYLADREIPLIFDEGGNGLKGVWTENGRWFKFSGNYRSQYKIINKIKPAVIKTVLKLGHGRIKETWAWPGDMRVFFNSELNKRNAASNGVPIYNAVVIHSGIEVRNFSFHPRETISNPIRIIIPGRVEVKKGQLDGVKLIQAFEGESIDAEIVIIGPRSSDGYYGVLVSEVEKAQINEKVKLFTMVHHTELIDLYHQSDICFFPSYHQSGFSRIPLEAMACGCITISYGNEGSDEVIRHGENGFLVKPGDYRHIVEIITDLLNSQTKYRSVVKHARHEIETNYSLNKYIDQIEYVINHAVESHHLITLDNIAIIQS